MYEGIETGEEGWGGVENGVHIINGYVKRNLNKKNTWLASEHKKSCESSVKWMKCEKDDERPEKEKIKESPLPMEDINLLHLLIVSLALTLQRLKDSPNHIYSYPVRFILLSLSISPPYYILVFFFFYFHFHNSSNLLYFPFYSSSRSRNINLLIHIHWNALLCMDKLWIAT